MKTKLCRPVLIEDVTEESLYSDRMYLISVNNRLYNPFENTYYQLVLVSIDPNEKIEVGDRVIYQMDDGHITDLIVDNTINTYPERWQGFKKVIVVQSRISPKYTLQFVEEFNKNEVREVEIEMTTPTYEDWMENGASPVYPKPKLTNGFITIVNKQDIYGGWANLSESDRNVILPNVTETEKLILYTEEEVKELCEKAFLNGQYYGEAKTREPDYYMFLDNPLKIWFETNKKK